MKWSLYVLFLVSVAGLPAVESKPNEVAERIENAAVVMDEIMAIPEKAIPQELLSKAHCVGIIPSMKKGGFIVGGRYGKGVMMCRREAGRGWTGPSTVRIEGGSFGLQIGGSAVDLVLLVMNERGAEKLMKSEFTLGGDASVAAGPIGRSAKAETDALMHAEILSYSRSRGVFAGISIEGATLRSDDSDNQAFYGRPVTHKQILRGEVTAPEAAKVLENTLNKYSTHEH